MKTNSETNTFPIEILEDVFSRALYDYDWSNTYIPHGFPLRGIMPSRDMLAANPGGWGVVLCMTADKCYKAAQAIDETGMLPDGIGKVISLDCDNLPERCQPEVLARALVELGVRPIYKEDGMLDKGDVEWAVSNSELCIHDISKGTFLIQYYGPASHLGDVARESLRQLYRHDCAAEHELNLRRTLLKLLPKWPADTDISVGVDALCYGATPEVDNLAVDYDRYEDALRINCRFSQSVIMDVGKGDEAGEWRAQAREQERLFSDIVGIWLHLIKQKWKITLGEYEPAEMPQLAELGEMLGVKSAVEAYMSGVPIDDIRC